ncbi:MAG: hypothetical protein ACI4X9_01745 [Kiritimatiellia bacterium]
MKTLLLVPILALALLPLVLLALVRHILRHTLGAAAPIQESTP